LEVGYNAIIQKFLPIKVENSKSFTIPMTIGESFVSKALLDLRASINLMPLSIMKRIVKLNVKSTRMTLQLVDKFVKHPYGIIEDRLIKVGEFTFLVDFVVMEID